MFNSKNVKRVISISAAAMCMLSSLRIAPLSINVDAADDVMTAFEITEAMTIGWNLGNQLDSHSSEDVLGEDGKPLKDENGNKITKFLDFVPADEGETQWGNPVITKELIQAVKAKGFNTIRIPTTWFQHLIDENDTIDPEWMARVHEVVDYVIDEGMFAILNVHHEESWVNRPDLGTAYDEMSARLIRFWTQIATEFKDYDQHLIFEGLNEPRAKGTDHEWGAWQDPISDEEYDTLNKLNADFVNTVRSIESPYKDTRLLMFPSYAASSDAMMYTNMVLPEDEYFAVSIHAYSPYDFTMNPGIKDHSEFTAAWSKDLGGMLDGLRATFLDKDIPVIIGEMGTSNYNNTEARVAWADQYISTAKAYGIPCVLWDNNVVEEKVPTGEAHGYLNRTTLEWNKVSEPVVDKMMEIINDDKIVWGSERHLPTFSHQAFEDGKVFRAADKAIEIDASKSKTYENTTPGDDGIIAWEDLEGKEVAIEYEGMLPTLCFSNDAYQNWTELKAYTVDDENGVAYYHVDSQLPAAWGESTDTIAHMQARTDKVTLIKQIVILDAPELGDDVVVDKTKKYKIKFTNAGDEAYKLVVTFKGEKSGTVEGCVGFMNGDDWDQVEFKKTSDADGTLVIEIPMNKLPKGVAQGEAQIWYADDETLELADYKEVAADAEPGTTTEPVAPTDGLVGDANLDGTVNLADAVLIMQYIANPSKYGLEGTDETHMTEAGKVLADCESIGNGVTNSDALAIQMYILKLFDKLPATISE